MACKITTIQKKAYTHFIVEGENTSDNTLYYIREIYKACITHHYKCILIEEQLEGKLLGTMDVYDVVSTISHEILVVFKAIAYVDTKLEKNTINFIENLALNRGLPVNTFATVEEAEKWLISQEQSQHG